MLLRLIASTNWALGCLALGWAGVYPLYTSFAVEKPAKEAVEMSIEALVKAERLSYLTSRERGNVRNLLVYFGLDGADAAARQLGLKTPIGGGDFSVEVLRDEGHVLVIRAFTSATALRNGKLPPLLYVVEFAGYDDLPGEKESIRGSWRSL